MARAISLAEFWEITTEIQPPQGFDLAIDPSESFSATPSLNCGYGRYLDLGAGIELVLWQESYFEDTEIICPTRPHPWVEFSVLLEGSYRLDTGVALKAGHYHLQGSGIAAGDREFYSKDKFCQCVNVHLDPAILPAFMGQEPERLPVLVQNLMRADDWQAVLAPRKASPTMLVVARQIFNCSLQGYSRRMYLQGKILELLALQLDSYGQDNYPASRTLKPQTIEGIYAARDILLANLEEPPTILDLAQRVGMSERTLQRGFRSLFGMTVFAYLTDLRMLQAECWLRSHQSVAEVANLVGYSNPGHFAAAFKRKFGITPTECNLGKKSML
jgi:AraC-like DNA-binding protein